MNTTASLTVYPTMINPEEKNCMVSSGNSSIPVSWWVSRFIRTRFCWAILWLSSVLLTAKMRNFHVFVMHKLPILPRFLHQHGLGESLGPTYVDECLLHHSFSGEVTRWIAALLAVLCSWPVRGVPLQQKNGERKQMTVTRRSTWSTAHSCVCFPHPSPHPDP